MVNSQWSVSLLPVISIISIIGTVVVILYLVVSGQGQCQWLGAVVAVKRQAVGGGGLVVSGWWPVACVKDQW